jgi:hypothetical protein
MGPVHELASDTIEMRVLVERLEEGGILPWLGNRAIGKYELVGMPADCGDTPEEEIRLTGINVLRKPFSCGAGM